MWQTLLALLLFQATAVSPYAVPVPAARAVTLAQQENAALAQARVAAADLQRLAKTPAEKAFAGETAQIVGAIADVVRRRQAARVPRAANGSASGQLLDQTKHMQEMQMSFNLQYLQLQNQMQNENRQYVMVSNIMKTKHDTVKNTISNIR